MTEDELFDTMIQSRLSVDMISDGIYEDLRKQLKYENVLTNEELLMARVEIYFSKSIQLLKVGEFLHSFTVIMGIYEIRLMEFPGIKRDYLDTMPLEYLERYAFKLKNRALSLQDKQILLELLLSEYDKYEEDKIFDFKHFKKMLENVIIGKDITIYLLETIEGKNLYKLEKDDYIIALKNRIFKKS